MEYDVVFSESLVGLIDKVNDRLKDGWRIAGSLVVSTYEQDNPLKGYSERFCSYYQPLHREIK